MDSTPRVGDLAPDYTSYWNRQRNLFAGLLIGFIVSNLSVTASLLWLIHRLASR